MNDEGKKNQIKRARKAVRILNAAYEKGEHAQNVRDMMTDIRHLCDVKGIDFYAEYHFALQRYQEERRGEPI